MTHRIATRAQPRIGRGSFVRITHDRYDARLPGVITRVEDATTFYGPRCLWLFGVGWVWASQCERVARADVPDLIQPALPRMDYHLTPGLKEDS